MIRYEDIPVAENLILQLGKECRIKPYCIDDENRDVIALLIAWACNDPAFEKSPLIKNEASLNKSLLLAGNVGSGKSLIMYCLGLITQRFPKEYNKKYITRYSYKIENEYTKKGPESLFSLQNVHRSGNVPNNLLIDELGYENPVKWFGNDKKEILADVIMHRDQIWNSHGIQTHFTTNLTMDELKEKYGERVESRLTGMCNIIYLGTKPDSIDRRKPPKK